MGIDLRFNEKKATQAAALFISLAGDRLNYMVLIKYLYLADRKALTTWGRLITNDRFYSMKLGPVLSNVLDLINEERMPDEDSYWYRFISSPSDYKVTLNEDPGIGKLSIAEEELIRETFEKYRKYQDKQFDFAKVLHDELPEWEKPKYGRKLITIQSILLAAQTSDEEISQIEGELKEVNFVDSLLSAEN